MRLNYLKSVAMFDFFKLKEGGRGPKFEEKKSKFVASGALVKSLEDVESFITKVKKEMKKATHSAYAYRIVNEDGIQENFDDDGEVKGCAGQPILNILQSYSLYNTIIIVTRYYGRIHLGPAGLIRQYSNTAKDLIQRIGVKGLNE